MLINLVPDFLATREAPDPLEAYQRYLSEHRAILTAYWRNYVLDLETPHAQEVIRRTLDAERKDLQHLLATVDIEAVAQETLVDCEARFEMDRPVDVVLMVGVGGANAGELVVGGRGVAFICLEHFTGRPNPDTYGLGLDPKHIPLWIAHELAHAVRYTSPHSASDLARLITDSGGYYDYWATGSRVSLRELLVNEGLAVLASEHAVPGLMPWDYLGYPRRQYRRLRELDAFLQHALAEELDRTGLGYRLRYLSGGMPPAQRLVGGKVVPERAGYYVGRRLAEAAVQQFGIARALRLSATDITSAMEQAEGQQTA
ncbi:MAG: DUF2268 domain-containing putative Zn-dependent protease [Gemmatimonadales bacterium]